MGGKYASEKKAFGFCDNCQFRYPLRKLRTLTVKTKRVNLRVCPECWDPDHPQLKVGMYPIDDPQALENPRPDIDLVQSRAMYVTLFSAICVTRVNSIGQYDYVPIETEGSAGGGNGVWIATEDGNYIIEEVKAFP